MKKLLNKVRRKKDESTGQDRITTDTLAEHRERILAGGRRFKYPVQYQRHKLVFNAIIVGVAALILLVTITWWQLYIVQNTSDFMYRVTRVIPVPVASVEGEQVRYSDYLLKYRGAMHYLVERERLNLSTEDGRRQSDFVKNREMSDVVADTYAAKLARERNINVTDVEVEELLKQQLSQDGISQESYNATIMDYYGWSPEEYREIIKKKLLRQKVAYAVDDPAKSAADLVGERIRADQTDLQELAESLTQDDEVRVTYGALGWLQKNNNDGGLTAAAAKLSRGQISGVVQPSTGDGYYFVKVIDSNNTQVNYEYIQVPLTVFADQLRQAESSNRVDYFIDLPEVETTNQTQQ
jgi:hypothetical protein